MIVEISNFMTYMKHTAEASANTVSSYQSDLLKMAEYLKEERGILEVQDVKEADLEAYIELLNQAGRKPATISRVISAMKRFYGYLLIHDQIRENPAQELRPPKVSKEVPAILTEKELQNMLDQIRKEGKKGLRDQAMLNLMCITGMHVSEIVNLKLEDVDLVRKQVGIGPKNVRYLSLDPKTLESLNVYLSQSRPLYARKDTGDIFFVSSVGRRISRQSVWKIVKEYAEKAGIHKDITPQTLRHTLICKMLADGEDLLTVKEKMGFAEVATAMVYSNLYKNEKE